MITTDSIPFAQEREVHNLVTQETRFLILQHVLAHPENLPTLRELTFAIPKGKSTIREHLTVLIEEGILDEYSLDERPERDLPKTFFGFTADGIDLIQQLGLLEGKPILQTMYDTMEKTDDILRYETAPRPNRASTDECRTGEDTPPDACDQEELDLDGGTATSPLTQLGTDH